MTPYTRTKKRRPKRKYAAVSLLDIVERRIAKGENPLYFRYGLFRKEIGWKAGNNAPRAVAAGAVSQAIKSFNLVSAKGIESIDRPEDLGAVEVPIRPKRCRCGAFLSPDGVCGECE